MTIHHLVTPQERSLTTDACSAMETSTKLQPAASVAKPQAPLSVPSGSRSIRVRGVGAAILVVALLLTSATMSRYHGDKFDFFEASHHSPWGHVGRLQVPVVLRRLWRTLFEASLDALRPLSPVADGAVGLVQSHRVAAWKVVSRTKPPPSDGLTQVVLFHIRDQVGPARVTGRT